MNNVLTVLKAVEWEVIDECLDSTPGAADVRTEFWRHLGTAPARLRGLSQSAFARELGVDPEGRPDNGGETSGSRRMPRRKCASGCDRILTGYQAMAHPFRWAFARADLQQLLAKLTAVRPAA